MSDPSSTSSPDKSAIARAIEARLKPASSDVETNQALIERRQRETKLTLAKIVDTQIRRDNNYQAAARCLQHLNTIITNIHLHPKEEKYRSLKPTNPTLSKHLFPISGAREFILELGFRLRRKDFAEIWILAEGTDLSNLGLEKIRLAKEVLEEKLIITETLAERETRMKKEESDFEKGRKARALQEFNEDRERRAQKDSAARRARERSDDTNKTPKLDLHQNTSVSSSSSQIESTSQLNTPSTSGRRLGGDLDSHIQNAVAGDEGQREYAEDELNDKDEDEDDAENSEEKEANPEEKVWGQGQRPGD